MINDTSRNIRVGVIVIISTAVMIAALYFIGAKQNLFGSTFKISSKFYNVNGLMIGNNVRLFGINVGTVSNVEIINDSSVNVEMVIEKRVQQFIKKNALTRVGTEGLMGNKLVEINSSKNDTPHVEEGDVLISMRPVEMDEVVRTLNATNENINVITYNLRNITDKIDSKNSLWNILMDTEVAENVKTAIVNLKLLTNNTIQVTGDLSSITNNIKNGKGTLGSIIMDTLFASKLNQTIVKFEKFSDTLAIISGDFSSMSRRLKQGQGSVGVLLSDTMLVHNLNNSINSIDSGASNFNQNMEALKHVWPFKKYFRKQSNSTKK